MTMDKKRVPALQNSISEDRLDGREIEDTTQCLDGILVLHCKDGEMLGYFREGDILLRLWEDGWTPLEEEAPRVKAFGGCLPDSVTVIIRKEDEVYDYYGCGIAHVYFAAGLRRIQEGMLSENPLLETVVIPSSVEEVDARAFENSTNLRELVIEGDPARVADWAENAFDGCPCEEYYKSLRRQAILHKASVQRCWRVPVRDMEVMLHDPELFGLSKQIEASLGRHARFMLRRGDHSEIRILVEAPSEEKCLLAMLRFTQAAKKKGYLVGSAEEEEL